jgi:spore coat polysaccharide biosynthesis protein SpsF
VNRKERVIVMEKVGIIIQARMGSTRLPGKVLRHMAGRPMLDWILDRLNNVTNADRIVVATTKSAKDDAIVQFCQERGTLCFRGSEENVLSRYVQGARQYGFQHVVRCTGDNPFHDPVEINYLIQEHLRINVEYSSNIDALPKGVGAEVFQSGVLYKIEALTKDTADLEHVNEYVLNHPSQFRTHNVSACQHELARTDFSLTVDTENEFILAEKLIKEMAKKNITRLADAVDIAVRLCREEY